MSASPVLGLDKLPVWKGHGTENDFVIIDDREDRVVLTAELTAALCDRRAGIGADGVLRAVRLADDPQRFFMDYRNSDGSLAEMCGNGARVFARYLRAAGLVDTDTFQLSTRAGDVGVQIEADGQVTVDLGPARALTAAPVVRVAGLASPRRGRAVAMPNPHVVVVLDDIDELRGLDLSAPPAVDPPLPDGQNVEFVVRTGDRRLAMRVHERGSGETRSCGTGIAAAVVAVQTVAGPLTDTDPGDRNWTIDVPGGSVGVRWNGAERVQLTGPAVLVARIELRPEWLADVSVFSGKALAAVDPAVPAPSAVS